MPLKLSHCELLNDVGQNYIERKNKWLLSCLPECLNVCANSSDDKLHAVKITITFVGGSAGVAGFPNRTNENNKNADIIKIINALFLFQSLPSLIRKLFFTQK